MVMAYCIIKILKRRGIYMRLSELLDGISYTAAGFRDVDVTDLVYDSRKVKPGCAFFCLKGAVSDGHRFAQQAAE